MKCRGMPFVFHCNACAWGQAWGCLGAFNRLDDDLTVNASQIADIEYLDTMDLFMFAICYVSFIVALLVVLLFGENPMLMGTPVAWLHWLLTQGPCAIIS